MTENKPAERKREEQNRKEKKLNPHRNSIVRKATKRQSRGWKALMGQKQGRNEESKESKQEKGGAKASRRGGYARQPLGN